MESPVVVCAFLRVWMNELYDTPAASISTSYRHVVELILREPELKGERISLSPSESLSSSVSGP